jgi:hypothetical protein
MLIVDVLLGPCLEEGELARLIGGIDARADEVGISPGKRQRTVP